MRARFTLFQTSTASVQKTTDLCKAVLEGDQARVAELLTVDVDVNTYILIKEQNGVSSHHTPISFVIVELRRLLDQQLLSGEHIRRYQQVVVMLLAAGADVDSPAIKNNTISDTSIYVHAESTRKLAAALMAGIQAVDLSHDLKAQLNSVVNLLIEAKPIQVMDDANVYTHVCNNPYH